MESATVIGIGLCSFLVAITGFAVYTAFGPPAAQLSDPFDDHED